MPLGRGGSDDELLGGRYRVGELLGVGGSASVHRADDLRGGPPVAVKILHPHLCADAAAQNAFLREARHAAAFTHGNVVLIHDAGLHEAGGTAVPWIALDLLTGPTLRDRVRQGGPLGVVEAATVADGILAGLEAAHAAGIVHRDISPQNVVLEAVPGAPVRSIDVRILDFGLADATGRSTVGDDILLAGEGSGDGPMSVVGNAHYMSPEQASGRPVRAGSDLYQVGAVLFFLLTGSPPFPRASTAEVLQAQRIAPPPVPSALVPGARPLDAVIIRALTKTPARRFRDAGEFRAALAEAVAGLDVEGTPAAPVPLFGPQADPGTGPTSILPGGPLPEDLGYLVPAAEREADTPVAEPAPPRGAAIVLGVGAVVLAAAVIAGAFIAGFASTAAPVAAEAEAAEPPPVVEQPSAPSPEPSPTPVPVPLAVPTVAPRVEVPVLQGDLASAEAALRRAGLVPGAVTRIDSGEHADRVLGQSPAPGASAAAGDSVDIVVASGRSTVPQTAGMTIAEATAAMEAAGFRPAADPPGAPATTRVARSDPAAGTVLPVGTSVQLRLESPPTPTPSPSPGGQP